MTGLVETSGVKLREQRLGLAAGHHELDRDTGSLASSPRHGIRGTTQHASTRHRCARPRRVGLLAAELVANRLRASPAARLLLPTGRSPLDMYAALRAHASQTAHMEDLEERMRGWFTANALLGGLPEGRLAESFKVIQTSF